MFRNRDRRPPLVIADVRASAVLAALDDALGQDLPRLTPPEPDAAAALRGVDESLIALESGDVRTTSR